jgi:hypothetical protein
MAKSFLTAPTATIVHTQQVVSSAATVAPSNSERAKAHCKGSTTHGPSQKEVVIITSLPTHWPDKPVDGLLNSYLGSYDRAICTMSKTQNHLRGLALVCDVLPVKDDIQVMHAYFNAVAKRIYEDNTTKTQVEVGLSKSFLCIPDFPYFGAKLSYNTKGEPIQSLHSRSRRSSLPPNGRTPYTCTGGLCPTWSETPKSWMPVQCSSTFMILEVASTSAASRAKASCLATSPLLSFLLKSRLESPSAPGVGGMATAQWCAPSRLSCAHYVLNLIIPSTITSLVHAAKRSPRQNLPGRQPLQVTPAPIQHGVSIVVSTTVPTAAPAHSGSTIMTPSGCTPCILLKR